VANIDQIAKKLDGIEYGRKFGERVEALIGTPPGVVVVYGYSDDLTEIMGAVYEEEPNGVIYIANGKTMAKPDDDQRETLKEFGVLDAWLAKLDGAIKLETDYTNDGFVVRSCSVPFARFSVMEDGERYGDGIVFEVEPNGQ
jgi:hypothetical protein